MEMLEVISSQQPREKLLRQVLRLRCRLSVGCKRRAEANTCGTVSPARRQRWRSHLASPPGRRSSASWQTTADGRTGGGRLSRNPALLPCRASSRGWRGRFRTVIRCPPKAPPNGCGAPLSPEGSTRPSRPRAGATRTHFRSALRQQDYAVELLWLTHDNGIIDTTCGTGA
jgi:hypothetical protein